MSKIFDKNSAVWFEIPATDFNPGVGFYEQVCKDTEPGRKAPSSDGNIFPPR